MCVGGLRGWFGALADVPALPVVRPSSVDIPLVEFQWVSLTKPRMGRLGGCRDRFQIWTELPYIYRGFFFLFFSFFFNGIE